MRFNPGPNVKPWNEAQKAGSGKSLWPQVSGQITDRNYLYLVERIWPVVNQTIIRPFVDTIDEL